MNELKKRDMNVRKSVISLLLGVTGGLGAFLATEAFVGRERLREAHLFPPKKSGTPRHAGMRLFFHRFSLKKCYQSVVGRYGRFGSIPGDRSICRQGGADAVAS